MGDPIFAIFEDFVIKRSIDNIMISEQDFRVRFIHIFYGSKLKCNGFKI